MFDFLTDFERICMGTIIICFLILFVMNGKSFKQTIKYIFTLGGK